MNADAIRADITQARLELTLRTDGYSVSSALIARLAAHCETLLTALDAEAKRADDWMRHAGTLRCPKCTHERGPIGKPRGIEEDGYRCVWVCPCDCHADVAALRAERDAALARVAELEDREDTRRANAAMDRATGKDGAT